VLAGRSDLDVRLADTLAAWNVFRHFYPYRTEAEVDWDRLLAADAWDGHGLVSDIGRPPQGVLLPHGSNARKEVNDFPRGRHPRIGIIRTEGTLCRRV
jgi:hypothetical protein